jgi:hypothetical protein
MASASTLARPEGDHWQRADVSDAETVQESAVSTKQRDPTLTIAVPVAATKDELSSPFILKLYLTVTPSLATVSLAERMPAWASVGSLNRRGIGKSCGSPPRGHAPLGLVARVA